MRVKVIPKSKRAKERVKAHGQEMILLQDLPEKFLVRSEGFTYANEQWMGWFIKGAEAKFEVVGG